MKKLLLILLCLPMIGFGQGYYCDTAYVSMQESTSQPIHSIIFNFHYFDNGWSPSDWSDIQYSIQNVPIISGITVGGQSCVITNYGGVSSSDIFQIDPLVMDSFRVSCSWETSVNNNASGALCYASACYAWDGSNWNIISCPAIQTSIQEHTTNKELLKVTDLLGRETKGTKNEVLFYIYDDGTVEKRIVVE